MTRLYLPDAPNPHAPTDRQLHRARQIERRWLDHTLNVDPGDDNTMSDTYDRLRDDAHRYATDCALVASTLRGVCRPQVFPGADPGVHDRSGPARPTERDVLSRIDRIDTAVHLWSHTLGPCSDCPGPDRPHDESLSLSTWTDPDAVHAAQVESGELEPRVGSPCDWLAPPRTILSSGFGGDVDRVSMVQQAAAGDVVAVAFARWDGGASVDELRTMLHEFGRVARRVRRVAHMIGARR